MSTLVATTPTIVTFTGHRDCTANEIASPVAGILQQILATRDADHVLARCGMAAGGDIICGEIAHDMGIPIHAFVPDPGYKARYVPPEWSQRFDTLLSQVTEVHYSSERHHWSNNNLRNDQMLDGADMLVACYRPGMEGVTKFRRPRGGTGHCIWSALNKGFVVGTPSDHGKVLIPVSFSRREVM